MFWKKKNCMKPDTTLSDYDSLESELNIIPEQNDYSMPVSYDAINEGMTYIDYNIEKIDTMSLKDKSDVLPNNFGEAKVFPEIVYNEDQTASFYELMSGLPMDSYPTTFSLSNDTPIRLSSPIQFNLSASLPNPTIEQFQSKKKSYPVQNTLNATVSPSSSNCGYESTSPSTYRSYCDTSNAFSSSLTTRAVSLSPISSAIDSTTSKKKSSPKLNIPNSAIKRPLNSFMLYRRDKQSSIPTNNHQSISRIIGEMWKRETIEEKERYAEMALRERERHAKEYPDYKFLPRKKKDKNANGKSPRKRKTYDPVLEQGESKILRMMLNQISHKKSQSDPEPFKVDQSNYHWFMDNKNKSTLKKTYLDTANNATSNCFDNLQLLPDTYEYPNPNAVPLPIFPIKNRMENAGVYGSLDAFLNTYDNLNDHEVHALMDNYSVNSASERWLGSTYNKSCTGSPQSIPTCDIKSVDTFSEKNEAQNISFVPVFDSTVLQDDMNSIQGNLTGVWDDTIELSSYSTSSNPHDNQDVLNRPSFELMNSGRVNLMKTDLNVQKIMGNVNMYRY